MECPISCKNVAIFSREIQHSNYEVITIKIHCCFTSKLREDNLFHREFPFSSKPGFEKNDPAFHP